ncbi:TetR/AcrR family transcriptional regulator [Tomitella biformata]|uniref:TetR/AcrR family transcriptional regulator n=1 Tax=Tomitella biformata TaxID=630403 RepID=UPI000465CCC1|nr:TetR/AcrR family transcriptional regulator [Tomitella biformata]
MTAAPTDPYADRIIDAAYALLSRHGLRRTTISDVVRESGVSRATLFRRFPSRSDLFSALMSREVTAFLSDLEQRLDEIADPVDRLVETFVRFCEVAPLNPVLRRLVESDPDTVLPHLTTNAEPILAFGRQFMMRELTRLTDFGYRLTASPEVCTDLITRISHSYLLLPPALPELVDHDLARKLFRATIIRMVIAD